ncbi:MAG: hypothetical protein H6R13_119 [Proteobacteria bacterium]|nr:hypothetical protein [Pseudomonadota bacterium]
MAEYHLLTTWRIKAPLTQVFDAIHDSLRWPEWWPGAEKVEPITDGDPNGINNIRRYSWQGTLPYPVVFDVRATCIKKHEAIEGRAEGDLEGIGRWRFSCEGQVSVVRFDWHVRSTKWWMNLLAPIARSIFISNHVRLMAQGGESLAALLQSSLIHQKSIDLMAKSDPPTSDRLLRLRSARINPLMIFLSGLFAGTIATIAQLALWWLNEVPVLATLLRDARLTAAIVMGPGVLVPPSTAQWDTLIVATLVHFGLSAIYAVAPALLACRLKAHLTLPVGALYGLAIYAVNLHGFTSFFPWFAVSRDWVTMVAHAVFGISLVGFWLPFCWQNPNAGISHRLLKSHPRPPF